MDEKDPGELERIRGLPKEVGVFLVIAGIGGILLPGPIGAPLLIVGGVILWPKAFRRVEDSFASRFPDFYRQGLRQLVRFLNDMDRRYPAESKSPPAIAKES